MLLGGGVRIITDLGTVDIELFWDKAPRAARNLYYLAHRGYYDNTIIHRVSPGLIIQAGDPTGQGTGGASIYGDPFEDEIDPTLTFDKPGLLAMANTGKPNTNGSQFFITLAPLPHLNGTATIFGKVKRGLQIVDKISRVKTTRNER